MEARIVYMKEIGIVTVAQAPIRPGVAAEVMGHLGTNGLNAELREALAQFA